MKNRQKIMPKMNQYEYQRLLAKTKENYIFKIIDSNFDIDNIKESRSKVCFLRHDVDFDPALALEIAELEAENDVVSTYTILFSGPFYNPLEKKCKTAICEIKKLGHEIGLHFDPTAYDIKNENELDSYIASEASILSDIVNDDVAMFAFHATTEFSRSCLKTHYGGLFNVYSENFSSNIQYTSDSNGYWRFRSWEELLDESHNIIQVLTHPVWWQLEKKTPPYETVVKFLLKRFDSNIDYYNSFFDGQNERVNLSVFYDEISEEQHCYESDFFANYSKDSSLYNILRKSHDEISIDEIKKIGREFFKKWK